MATNLTNDCRSLLTNKIIRQKVGGEEVFKMEKKMQTSVSIHKKDHAKTRSILIKIGILATHLQHCRESTAVCVSWRKRRSHLTAAASGQNSDVSLESSQQDEHDAITLLCCN